MRLVERGIDLPASIADETSYLEFPFPPAEGAEAGRRGDGLEPRAILSLRGAGDLRYLAGEPSPARRAFFASLGLEPGRIVATELHHTRRLRFIQGGGEPGTNRELDAAELPGEDVGDGGPDRARGRDGIVVQGPAAALRSGLRLVPAVTVADCMPIWILDRHSGAYGVLHSGWKGTGILANAVRHLEARWGTPPASLAVILGPAIGACCYAVPDERARSFEAEFGPGAVDRSGPSPRIDIRSANIGLARSLGVGALLAVEACTSCEPLLGSFRREGAGRFTRMVALCLPR